MTSQPRRAAQPPRRPSTPRPPLVTTPRRFDPETSTWHGRVCPTCRVETPTSGVCDTCP